MATLTVGRTRALVTAAIALVVVLSVAMLPGLQGIAIAIALTCIVLWLSEVVPPFVPTLLLVGATPLLLGRAGPSFELQAVLKWPVDPVLALFFGGFALSAAAARHGVDRWIASSILRFSGSNRLRLVAISLAGTAFVSMWISNVAAAAMMFAVLKPLLDRFDRSDHFRAAVIVAVAMGANVGGMMSPIGSGPNGIAIAAVAPLRAITFWHWILFAVPLAGAALLIAFALIYLRFPVRGVFPDKESRASLSPRARAVIAVFFAAVLLWLTEPLHAVPAAVIALLTAGCLFGTGLLAKADLAKIDWSTLGLVAGGIAIGRLLDASGVVELAARSMPWQTLPTYVWISGLVGIAALLSAVMSNTGTAALLIPIALQLSPTPAVAIIVAIATSFGVPFVISTPPNALAYGEGATSRDILWVGLPLMLLGCLIVALTGSAALAWFGL